MRTLLSSPTAAAPAPAKVDPMRLPAVFEAYYDPALHRIFTFSSGFWTLADSTYFVARIAAVVEEATRAGDDFTCLADFSNAPIQAPAVSEANGAAARIMGGSTVRRCAVVTSTALKAIQLRRVVTDPRIVFFGTPTDALRWLDEPGGTRRP